MFIGWDMIDIIIIMGSSFSLENVRIETLHQPSFNLLLLCMIVIIHSSWFKEAVVYSHILINFNTI